MEGSAYGVYRTDRDRIVRVDLTGSAWALSVGGDVAVLQTSGAAGVYLLAPTGELTTVLPLGAGTGPARYVYSGGPLYLNASGSLAFLVNAHGGAASLLALRWSAGQLDQIVASGDPVPGGAILASGGLNPPGCLADDGRIVIKATATDGSNGLICLDADGPHVLVQSGDLAPDDFEFYDFGGPCSFTADGAVIFSGYRPVPMNGDLYTEASVYRASSKGIERVFGDGDAVGNDTVIEDSGSSTTFVANGRGSVLAHGKAWAHSPSSPAEQPCSPRASAAILATPRRCYRSSTWRRAHWCAPAVSALRPTASPSAQAATSRTLPIPAATSSQSSIARRRR